MAGPVIRGASSTPTEDDTRKRELVKELMKSENKSVADFAKHQVTLAFSAIGVVLALKEKWLGEHASSSQLVLLGVALALYLASALTSAVAAGVYGHRVSLSDYDDVDAELHRVAKLRYRLVIIGLILMAAATVIVAFLAL
jgi:MFS family permease